MLEAVVDQVIADEVKTVAEIRSGKNAAIGRLIGVVRKKEPSADPIKTKDLLEAKLGIKMPGSDKPKSTTVCEVYRIANGSKVIVQWRCDYDHVSATYHGSWCSLVGSDNKNRFKVAVVDLLERDGEVELTDL